jgi:hypothetical protein
MWCTLAVLPCVCSNLITTVRDEAFVLGTGQIAFGSHKTEVTFALNFSADAVSRLPPVASTSRTATSDYVYGETQTALRLVTGEAVDDAVLWIAPATMHGTVSVMVSRRAPRRPGPAPS